MFIYWLLFALSVLGLLGCVTASVTMAVGFRERLHAVAGREALCSLSMIVPIKGVDAATASHLHALVESNLQVPVEYLFALESSDDPAFAVCQTVKHCHPDKQNG